MAHRNKNGMPASLLGYKQQYPMNEGKNRISVTYGSLKEAGLKNRWDLNDVGKTDRKRYLGTGQVAQAFNPSKGKHRDRGSLLFQDQPGLHIQDYTGRSCL